MTDVAATTVAKPIWIDLTANDAERAKAFYSALFGWTIPEPDPAHGGYVAALLGGRDVAGIMPAMEAGQPSAWHLYIATADAEATLRAVESAGGRTAVAPMDVSEAGRMAGFTDPSGAFLGLWQPGAMPGFAVRGEAGSFGWAELDARGLEADKAFYKAVFGWSTKTTPMGEMGDYTEWQVEGESIAGGMEMPATVPAEMPSYWMVYFQVDDVPAATDRAVGLGATVMVGATDYPGGKFSILSDPQGAMFGLVT